MNALPTPIPADRPAAAMPRYELWVRSHGPDDLEMEVWQVPAPATPHIKAPVRIAGLRGRNLALVEHRVLRRLAKARIKLAGPLAASARPSPWTRTWP